MADIELVIKIPEELLSKIDDENYQSVISWYDTTLYCAIKDGTPLPKGHGRLIDGDTLYREIETEGWFDSDDEYYGGGLEDIVLNAPTIIEADKENKE